MASKSSATIHAKMHQQVVTRRDALQAGVEESRITDLYPEDCRRADGAGALGMIQIRNFWIYSALDLNWTVAYRLVGQAGRAVIGEVRIFPNEGKDSRGNGQWAAEWLGSAATVPQGGLTATAIKTVRLGTDLLHATRMVKSAHRQDHKHPLIDMFQHAHISKVQSQPGKTKGGRPPGDDRWYARVAQAYVAACARGSRKPVAEALKSLRLPLSDLAKVRDGVHRARALGFLTPTGQGRSGGVLTPEARAALSKRR